MLVTAVAVGLGLFLIGWLAPVLAPMGLGLFLAALAAPLFSWLERRGGSADRRPERDDRLVLVVVGGGLVLLGLQSARSLATGSALRRVTRARIPARRRSTAGVMARSASSSRPRCSSTSSARSPGSCRGRRRRRLRGHRRGAAPPRRPAPVAPRRRRARQPEPGVPRGARHRPGRRHVLRGADPRQRGDGVGAAGPAAPPRRRRRAALGRRGVLPELRAVPRPDPGDHPAGDPRLCRVGPLAAAVVVVGGDRAQPHRRERARADADRPRAVALDVARLRRCSSSGSG